MTEKNYGGATSFGFKDKNLKSNRAEMSIHNASQKENKSSKENISSDIFGEELENYIRAGEIAKKAKEYLKEIVRKDVLIIEIAEGVENKIREMGGEIAFPTNISIDEVAAHYTPTSEDETRASGLIKIDIGVEVGGYIADTAISFDLTEDKKYSDMIKLNELVLEKVIEKLKIGSRLKEVGNTISEIVEKDGRYKIIKNLSGHSLDRDSIHAGITVSNLANENNFELKNIAIAIEPFLTEGKGEIFEGKPSEIYILKNVKLSRDRDARNLLNFISENYREKPFCKRWLEKENIPKLNYCLSLLVREGMLYNFPVLIEKERKVVSQCEHTLVFSDKIYVTTK